MTQKRPKKMFVDNAKFYEVLVDYKNKCQQAKELGQETPIIPDYLGKTIIDIATNLASRYNFANYTFRDEMVSDGIERAVYALHKFNPDIGKNPFAYFTQIIYFAFVVRIKNEKKHSYIKHKALESLSMQSMLDTNGDVIIDVDLDKSAELVAKFESDISEEKKVVVSKKKKSSTDVESFFEEDNNND